MPLFMLLTLVITKIVLNVWEGAIALSSVLNHLQCNMRLIRLVPYTPEVLRSEIACGIGSLDFLFRATKEMVDEVTWRDLESIATVVNATPSLAPEKANLPRFAFGDENLGGRFRCDTMG
jgi:hypothetical protein